MLPLFDYGDAVRVIRDIHNDATYPDMAKSDSLIQRGSVGYVRNRGRLLRNQIIYSVHFIEQGGVTVGCRESELIAAETPWIPNRFEFREKVVNQIPLVIDGEVIQTSGSAGEIVKVLRKGGSGVMYHVRFPGRTLLTPEEALAPLSSV